jgi:hypothetical protein
MVVVYDRECVNVVALVRGRKGFVWLGGGINSSSIFFVYTCWKAGEEWNYGLCDFFPLFVHLFE